MEALLSLTIITLLGILSRSLDSMMALFSPVLVLLQ